MRRKSVSKKENLFAASRFVLPEHREWYLRQKAEEARFQPPELDEEQRAAMSQRLWQAFQQGRELAVLVYDSSGPRRLSGRVVHLDPALGALKLKTAAGVRQVAFDSLLDVELL